MTPGRARTAIQSDDPQQKPLLGCHVSVAGGVHRAFERGSALDCTAIQIFTRNQRQWQPPPLADEEVDRYRRACSAHAEMPAGIRVVLSHGSYLINLAADPIRRGEIGERSEEALLDELERASRLRVPLLMVHPGSHGGRGEHRGVDTCISRINEVMGCFTGTTTLLIETTAGQGNGIGYRFEHIRDILQGVERGRVGACIDTCHIFGAGYDIRSGRAFRRTMESFDRTVGLSRLKALHLNDSVGALGSRVDRHTHIGLGEIGIRAFSLFMREFPDVPKILETPKIEKGRSMDRANLDLLRELARKV
jgi:deoxyribonuclease-4